MFAAKTLFLCDLRMILTKCFSHYKYFIEIFYDINNHYQWPGLNLNVRNLDTIEIDNSTFYVVSGKKSRWFCFLKVELKKKNEL